MIEQSISHLIVKISLLYVIHNRSYSHLKNVPEREHCQFWVNLKKKLNSGVSNGWLVKHHDW